MDLFLAQFAAALPEDCKRRSKNLTSPTAAPVRS